MFEHYQNALLNALFGEYNGPYYYPVAQLDVEEEPSEFYFWLGAEAEKLYKPQGFAR